MSISRRNVILGVGGVLAGGLLGATFSAGRGWRSNSQIPRALQVKTEDTLPAEVDVVVIGGGVAGLSSALFLNERGLRTIVLEKGVVAGEQSGRAFGWIYSNNWDLGKLELANRSKEIWQGFSARFGEDIGFRQGGNFSLLSTDEEVEQSRKWLESALEIQPEMDAKILTGGELDALIAGAAGTYKAALYQASDGSAEPTFSVSKIAQGAMREGIRIIAPCAARTIEREAGKVAGVHTELGYVKAKAVVLAGGAWSSMFARNAGISFPQLAVSSHLQRLSRIEDALPGSGYGPDFAWCRTFDGETILGALVNTSPITADSFRHLFDFLPALKHSAGLVKVRLSSDFFESLRLKTRWNADEVTPFEDIRMLSGNVDHRQANIELANLRRANPQYERAVLKERWGGMIDATPDSTQFVTDVPDLPGLFVVTGFSGNGLTTGPASGEMIAQIIEGEKTTCDRSIYRFNRFTDGSDFVFRN